MGPKASTSRKGNRLDDAPVEGFFHALEVELVRRRSWATRDGARRDLSAYAEGHYNRQGIHSALGYVTPVQAERKMAS